MVRLKFKAGEMTVAKNVVAVIPARGGSSGILNKNIREFAGKPLIAWTIELALATNKISRVIVSTDSERIADISRAYGAEVPFMRPAEISLSKTPIEPVLVHVYDWLKLHADYRADALVLLFPTNPLRKIEHLDECLNLFFSSSADSVFTVNESPAHYTPYWSIIQDKNGRVSYFGGLDIRAGYGRRQDFPQKCYAKNDLVFVINPKNLFQSEASLYGVDNRIVVVDRIFDGDINTAEDWNLTLALFGYIFPEKIRTK